MTAQPGQPPISIVTVVKDGMPFISRTVESVAAQDYPAVEHWVVDGGSTDGTVEVLRRARLSGWTSEPDGGIADAFNKGLDRARGDYVMFLNADDELATPGSISALVEAARQAGWPEVIYGDCDLVDRRSGAVLYRHSVGYERRRFLRGGTLPHPGMLMHRRYFERFGRFDTSYRIAMDYELQLRGVPQVGAVHAPVLVSRVRTGGESTLRPMRAVDENLRALRKNGYLRSRVEEGGWRAYYRLRFAARRVLEALGLHERYNAVRRGMPKG